MGADVSAVEGGGLGNPSPLGQGGQHDGSETALKLAAEPVVYRGGRAVPGRTVARTAACAKNVYDATDDAAVVLPVSAELVVGHERLDHDPLLDREPEQIRHHPLHTD